MREQEQTEQRRNHLESLRDRETVFWTDQRGCRRISSAASGLSSIDRISSMSRRIASSTSCVVHFPNRIQMAFGGVPRCIAKKPKSLSFETTTKLSRRQNSQIETTSLRANPACSVCVDPGNKSASF